jgi:hypothetical protein
MSWISVEYEGWASSFVVIRSSLGETERYFGYSKKEAERMYRQKYGLVGKRMKRIKV